MILNCSEIENLLTVFRDTEMGYGAYQKRLTDAPQPSGRWKFSQFDMYVESIPRYIKCLEFLDRSKYRFHPAIEVLLDCLQANPIPNDIAFNAVCKTPGTTTVELQPMRGFVSQFLADLRTRVLSKAVGARMNRYEIATYRRFNRMKAHIDKFFAAHASRNVGVVLGIRLGYGNRCMTKLEDVEKNMNDIIADMKSNAMFNELNSFIASIDYDIYNGFNIHFVLFFEGEKQLGFMDSHYPNYVGKYWSGCIARENGSQWTTNSRDTTPWKIGVRTISITEHSANGSSPKHVHLTVLDSCKKRNAVERRMNLNPKTKRLHKGTSIRHGAVRGIKRKSVLASD